MIMAQCDKLDLLKLQGQYLGFIVESHTELSVLEHIEECTECRAQIIESVEQDEHLPEYSDLFQRELKTRGIPQFNDYTNAGEFIDARIDWRKKRLRELIKEAEGELEDIETQL